MELAALAVDIAAVEVAEVVHDEAMPAVEVAAVDNAPNTLPPSIFPRSDKANRQTAPNDAEQPVTHARAQHPPGWGRPQVRPPGAVRWGHDSSWTRQGPHNIPAGSWRVTEFLSQFASNPQNGDGDIG